MGGQGREEIYGGTGKTKDLSTIIKTDIRQIAATESIDMNRHT